MSPLGLESGASSSLVSSSDRRISIEASDAGHPARKAMTVLHDLDLKGRRTDLVIERFGDRVMVLVTQTGKAGAILRGTQETAVGGTTTFSIDTLLGRLDQEPLFEVIARAIIEEMKEKGDRGSLLLCLGLVLPLDPGMAHAVIDVVKENLVC